MVKLHTETWGHVGLSTSSTVDMESAEEACETAMLRCRYGKIHRKAITTAPDGFFPPTSEIIHNPGTLQDIAGIFEKNIK